MWCLMTLGRLAGHPGCSWTNEKAWTNMWIKVYRSHGDEEDCSLLPKGRNVGCRFMWQVNCTSRFQQEVRSQFSWKNVKTNCSGLCTWPEAHSGILDWCRTQTNRHPSVRGPIVKPNAGDGVYLCGLPTERPRWVIPQPFSLIQSAWPWAGSPSCFPAFV